MMASKKEAKLRIRRIFCAELTRNGLPCAEPEYRFHHKRKWRLDYAWPEHLVALEVEGGVWARGRHTRAKGFLADMEKYNSAAVLGWRILRCIPQDMVAHETIAMLKEVLPCNSENLPY